MPYNRERAHEVRSCDALSFGLGPRPVSCRETNSLIAEPKRLSNFPTKPAWKWIFRETSGISTELLSLVLPFFVFSKEIFPFDRPPLFNPNLRTQSVLLFLRQLVRPDNQRFQLREPAQIPH
jgi:hypothetical protein